MKKKDILFYTFLLIFIITAAITLLGIVEIIQIKDGYLNTLVGVFAVELAGAVIALFRKADFFTEEAPRITKVKQEGQGEQEEEHATPGEPTKESAEPPPHCDLSAAEYFRRTHELEDRFHEQEEFINKYNGHTVQWTGFVHKISTINGNVSILMHDQDPAAPGILVPDISRSIAVGIPEDLRTKAYALRKGDYIVVTGVLNNQFVMIGAGIRNASFDLERKASTAGT